MKIFSLINIIVYSLLYVTNDIGNYGGWLIPVTILLYVVENMVYLYKYRRDQLLCFEFFFSIAFFLCSFLTPFVFPLLDSYQGRAFVDTEYNLLKVYILCFIGYNSYMFGLCLSKQQGNHTLWFNVSFNRRSCLYSNLLCFFFIVCFYIMGGGRLISLYSDLASDLNQRYGNWGEYMIYAMYAYTISIVTNFSSVSQYASSLRELIKQLPFLFYVNSILLVIPLLLSGVRSSAAQLLIPMLLMYGISIKKMRTCKVLAIILVGYATMIMIGMTRAGDGVAKQDSLFLTLVYDFVSANGANSFLVNYADIQGFTGGSNMLLQLASIVPFMQSFILLFIPRSSLALSSSTMFTNSFMDSTQGGMGTALIGDIYYTFGVIGVIILMFLLGYFLKKLYKSHNSPYALVILMSLSGNAIFAARVEYCFILRSLSYTAIFLFIILSITKDKNIYENRLRNR